MVIPIVQIRKMRHQARSMGFAQDYIASKCHSQDANPDRMAPGCALVTTALRPKEANGTCSTKDIRELQVIGLPITFLEALQCHFEQKTSNPGA